MSNTVGLVVMIWVAAAWLTHVVTSIQTAKWLLLLVGAIFFPVGCVHGTGIWFGVF
jgi:hypothetical protein